MTPEFLIDAIAQLNLPSTFNPYSQRCPIHDRADAPMRRRANLRKFITTAIASRVDTIWIGRDLGYRGGRRTGVPFTDEVHLNAMQELFGGTTFSRATRGPLVAERTAAIVWRVIRAIGRPVFLWNVFPLHPFGAGDPMSNRCHTRLERLATRPILIELIEMIRPKRIIAVGRDAELALAEFGLTVAAVRHPSYGGQSEFVASLAKIYGLKRSEIVA